MTMAPETHRPFIRRRSDGIVQIHALRAPPFSLGALRTLGLGAVGISLLAAALLATPFWLAMGARPAGTGRGGTSHMLGK
ncbi:MAG TPA: hypothetical protein VLT47_13695 [Anaeromyxobacteraceae bacterium]|nr:hypothetical protein [Anaeromyxobacteraceae bacterium]